MKTAQARSSNEATVKNEPRQKENFNVKNGVTLSGLLNVLDGFFAPSGVLFIMTTNHIEELDPALLRPGRIDYKLYLGRASDEQKIALYLRFFADRSRIEAREFVRRHELAETMADFQGLLLAEAEVPIATDGTWNSDGGNGREALSVLVR